MPHVVIELPADPERAAAILLEASREAPVVAFKKSPACPVSVRAEERYGSWLAGRGPSEREIRVVEIDVIDDRPLARGLTAALDVEHQSPQALIFKDGALSWHGSHDELTVERFVKEVDG